MSKEKGEKRKSGGAGKVFLGIFLGILLTLGSIFGFGCFAYFKGSVNLLNKLGVHFSTGSEKLDAMTLADIVNSGAKAFTNANSMTLDDLANEFGYTLADEIAGIDITDIKQTPLSNLATVIKEKFEKYTDIENLTLGDVFGNTANLESSVLGLIGDGEELKELKIGEVFDTLQTAVQSATIDKLQSKGILNIDNYNKVPQKIKDMTLAELVEDYIKNYQENTIELPAE